MNTFPAGRWPDDRIDELSSRVGRLEPVVTEVAVMRTEMRNLTRELKANTEATAHVAEQFEKAQVEPIARYRNFRTALIVGLITAVAGGGLAILGAVLASGGH